MHFKQHTKLSPRGLTVLEGRQDPSQNQGYLAKPAGEEPVTPDKREIQKASLQ